MRLRLALLAVPLIALAGCGGGGGSTSSTPTGGGTVSLGSVSAVYSGTTKPLITTTGSGALITGLSGAAFSKILASAPPTSQSQTNIAFSSKGALYLVHPDGTGLRQISPNSGNTAGLDPTWYPATGGALFYLDRIAGANTNFQLFRRSEDGSGLLQLTNINYLIANPYTGNSKIVFSSTTTGKSQIYTCGIDGSNITQVSDGTANDYYPILSPSGTTIYYEQVDGTLYSMYSMSITGANPTKLFSLPGQVTVAISPDGGSFAYQTSTSISILPPNGLPFQATTPPTGSADSSPSFSPDGKMLAFRRVTGTSGTLMVQNVDGSNLQPFTDATFNVTSVSWGPAVGNRLFIGTPGTMGTTASGFLLGEAGTNLTSMLTFTCTTPSTATITPQTGSGGGTNAVFQISGDSVTSLKYTNDIFAPVTTLIPGSGGTTATGALVSYNLQTGLVSLVVPYASTIKRTSQNGVFAYSGRFLGIYDGKGNNLAPGGAVSVQIDATGRKLISRR